MGTSARPQPWKYGDCKPVMSKAKKALVAIAKGDMIGQAAGSFTGATSAAALVAGDVYPASDHVWNTNLATTQEEFHDAFLGIAHSTGKSADTDEIRTGTSGVHEFDCASATFKVGDLVGPAKQTGNLLEDQKVVAVATANLATGRVARSGTSVTKVWVEVFSTILLGGPQVPA